MAPKINGQLPTLAARFFLLIVLPFAIGWLVLPHVQVNVGSQLQATSDKAQITDSLVYTFSHGGAQVQEVSGVANIFPLAGFLDFPPLVAHSSPQVCFIDTGSALTLANGSKISPRVQWTVVIDGRKEVKFDSASPICLPISDANGTNYVWNAKIDAGVAAGALGSETVFEPKTATYPTSSADYGFLQGLVMIPVFYLLVWYPLFGIVRKLRDGMEAQ